MLGSELWEDDFSSLLLVRNLLKMCSLENSDYMVKRLGNYHVLVPSSLTPGSR